MTDSCSGRAADRLDDHVDQLRAAMAWASRQVLAGYEIRTGVEQVVRHPDHFRVDHPLWDRVMGALERVEEREMDKSVHYGNGPNLSTRTSIL